MTREKNSIELLAAMAADPAMHRSMDALSRARKVRDWLIEFALDHMGKLDALQTENARLKSDLVAAGASYSGVIRTMGECREKADQRIAELEAAICDWYEWAGNDDPSDRPLDRLNDIAKALLDGRGGVTRFGVEHLPLEAQDRIITLRDRITELEAEVARLKDALIWCSGSADFGPGGQAAVGWNKVCRPLLDGRGE